MPSYPASKLRIAFEILQRSGRLDQVERSLTEKNFSVEVSQTHAEALAAELNTALPDLKTKDEAYYNTVVPEERGAVRPQRRSGDCPCDP